MQRLQPLPSPDELRRLLRHASTLLAAVGNAGADPLAILCNARRSIASALARVDALIDAEDNAPLTPAEDAATIEGKR